MDLKGLIDIGVNAGLLGIVLWLAKAYYNDHVSLEIKGARVAANAAQQASDEARKYVLALHETVNKSVTELNAHYAEIIKAQEWSKNADHNTRRLSRLYAQLAKKNIEFETEIKRIGESLLLFKTKK